MNALSKAMPGDLWQKHLDACFGHLKREPEPQPTRHDTAVAEQFGDELGSITTDLASDASTWSAMLRDGRRFDCGLNASQREEMLTELMRWSAVLRSMVKGEI